MFRTLLGLAAVVMLASTAGAASEVLKSGTPDVQQAGPLAFAPDGMLLLADPQSAAVFVIDTKDAQGDPNSVEINVPDIKSKIAAMLGTESADVVINDVAVNPASGAAYLSISRGRGPDGTPVVLRVNPQGELEEVSLESVAFAKAELPNAPEDRVVGQGRGRGNPRQESITDIAFVDDQVIVAGLSNEEFSSNLRSISYPFQAADEGASVEIFHGAHGRFETNSPVRTFAVYDIDNAAHLLAAYTCTPLVKIPVAMLRPGEKIKGETVAELGNRNRPLDMIIYEDGGEDFVLMANSSRGLMKISLDNVAEVVPIIDKIDDKAGLGYETIEGATGIEQLDRLNDGHALVLVQNESGSVDLKTMELP